MNLFKIIKEHIRRSVKNYKIYLVSILGMSIAIIATFQIYHYVYKELSVDQFHSNKKEIYRVVSKRINSSFSFSNLPSPLGIKLKEKFPQIKNYTRIKSNHEVKLQINDFIEKTEVSYIDASFFDVFDFHLIEGNLSHFKSTPNGVIISEKIAKKHFQNKNPIGQEIILSEEYNKTKTSFQVTGILKNISSNSTIRGDYFINIDSYQKKASVDNKWISVDGTNLYLQIPNLNEIDSLSKKIGDLLLEYQNTAYKALIGEGISEKYFKISLQKLDNIYFDSTTITDHKHKGDIRFLKIIIIIGILTLILATFNYILMNLGLNLNRAKEFKIKRHLGASKKDVFIQLIIESQLNTIICFLLALISFPFIQNRMATIIGFDYQLSFINDFFLLISFFAILLIIGFITGGLEYLSSYKSIFSDKVTTNNNSWLTKKIMIIFQLFLFISLTICILFISKQMHYIEHKNLGFNTKNTVTITTKNHKELKEVLESKSYVRMTSYSYSLFSESIDLASLTNKSTKNKIDVMLNSGDYNFIDIHEMKLLYGSNFKKIIPSEVQKTKSDFVEILVNEEFVKKSNLANPIDKIFFVESQKYIIKGVFKNVFNTPLYYGIQPLAIVNRDYNSWYYGSLIISYNEGSKNELEQFIKDFYIKKGADPIFFDTITWGYSYENIYKKELLLKRLLNIFTIIILFISLLGMVAISLFITESKTKEIGIRKVNGATIKEILTMLNKDFIKWVFIAFIFACPISYYIMNNWLENFAYKTALSWWIFVLAGLFTLTISLLTVSWQTYKSATQNPVKSLRNE